VDIEELMYFIQSNLKTGEVIGVAPECYNGYNSEFAKRKITERPYGFGTMMFMKRSSYTLIPDDILIWCGDDIQIQTNKAYVFSGVHVETKMNTTVNSFRSLAEQDIEKMQKYDLKKLKKLSPIKK
jgi:hypothetical protein